MLEVATFRGPSNVRDFGSLPVSGGNRLSNEHLNHLVEKD
jgi:hypothetical protein